MKANGNRVRGKKAVLFGWRQRLFMFLLCLMPFVFAETIMAAEATLAWDPSSGSVAGYKLYYGFASRSYSTEINVGNVTQYTVTGLQDGRTYYFAVKAYDSQGNYSDYSNELECFTLTASSGTGGSISPSGTVIVSRGASKTFSITPAAGFAIASVLVDGASVGVVSSYTFSNVTSVHTITANFAQLASTITATAGPNGSISPSGSVQVAYGGSQGFTITPASGYKVSDVKVDGVSVGAVTSYTFSNVTSSRTIAATFEAMTYNIKASAGSNGTISPAGTVTVTHGGSQGFTITPASGYKVSDVKVDGVSVGAVTSYTFSNVTSSRTIAATFEQFAYYTITATAGANGTITPSGTVQVAPGGSQSFIISPSLGYAIADVLVDGVSVGPVTTYTFSNLDRSRSISVSFSSVVYKIKASARAAGSITPSGEVTVNYGSSQTFNIQPKTGYRISDVLVDGVSVGPVSSYTFTSVKNDHMISAGFEKIATSKRKTSITGLYAFRDRKIVKSNPLILAGTGYDPGFGGWVDMVEPGGEMERSIYLPWPEYISLSGELRLAVGDLEGDGEKEIIVGLGPVEGVEGIPGGYFAVLDKAYSLKAWGCIPWEAYNSLNGESRPSCGDLDGDGKDEIVIGLGPGGQGRLAVFKFAQNAVSHVKWLETGWEDYNNLNGEIRPACADLDGDGIAEIVVGLGRVDETPLAPDGMYLILADVLKSTTAGSGTDVAGWGKIEWPDYNAVNGELWPAKADVNGDGKDEIVLGLGLEGGGRFTVVGFDLARNEGSHMAWQQTTWPEFHSFGVEVRPAGGNLDYDRYDEIALGFGAGSKGFLETFDDGLHNFEPLARISYVAELRPGKGVETWPAILE
jgi:hypothetical protein